MSFTDAEAAARYAQGPVAQVPGFLDMQRMARLLLVETIGSAGRVLVLGAGGGLELRAFAMGQQGWRFLAIDPSAPMLDRARDVMGDMAGRVDWHQGTVLDAPEGWCDGATSLLVSHFIARDQRVPTLRAVHQRLRPGAPFIQAHISLPKGQESLWLARYAAFSADSGMDPERAKAGAAAIAATLPVQSPEEDEADLRAAGFTDPQLFYAGFAFRGWIALA